MRYLGLHLFARPPGCASRAHRNPLNPLLHDTDPPPTLSVGFWFGEVLLNYGACFSIWKEQRESYEEARAAHPGEQIPFPEFPSTFQVFYFINDLEHSIQFAPDSTVAERIVVGIPCGPDEDYLQQATRTGGARDGTVLPVQVGYIATGVEFHGFVRRASFHPGRKIPATPPVSHPDLTS